MCQKIKPKGSKILKFLSKIKIKVIDPTVSIEFFQKKGSNRA